MRPIACISQLRARYYCTSPFSARILNRFSRSRAVRLCSDHRRRVLLHVEHQDIVRVRAVLRAQIFCSDDRLRLDNFDYHLCKLAWLAGEWSALTS